MTMAAYHPWLLVVTSLVVLSVSQSQSQLTTYTNGVEYVVWNHAGQVTNHKRGAAVTCEVKRDVPLEELSQSVVRRSDSEFKEDKKLCDRHGRHKRMIMLGTNWCGAGDQASHFDDLGYYEKEDKCCRAHDHCDRNLVGGGSKYGVDNTSPYTWSDCECDRAFRQCLTNLGTFMGDTIGDMFFNILKGIKCIEFENDGTATEQDKGDYSRKSIWDHLTGWLG